MIPELPTLDGGRPPEPAGPSLLAPAIVDPFAPGPAEQAQLAAVDALDATARATFREVLKQWNGRLLDAYRTGASVDHLVRARAHMVDLLLCEAWRAAGLAGNRSALLAVGGYGRGELHPASDVDVALVIADGRSIKRAHPLIEPLVTFLWDIGLEIGVSVRTVRECAGEARKDLSVITNLIESRHVCGDSRLQAGMTAAIAPPNMWPAEVFLAAKLAEQIHRHKRFHDSAQSLEPNLKEGPGGLRDIQTIGWVAKRAFGVKSLEALAQLGFLLPQELAELLGAQSFLWRCRWALHVLTHRREDRLLFDHQRSVASDFGFASSERGSGLEPFMKLYYQTAITVSRLNELLVGLLSERLRSRVKVSSASPLNRRFQSRDGLLEAVSPQVFRQTPYAILEPFLILQQNQKLQGIAPATIRLIREQAAQTTQSLRNDLRARSLFMEILRQPRRLGEELERMHRYGVLENYLPVFGKTVGMMQFDLFHVYTVDEHTLKVVGNLCHFWRAEPEQESPQLCRNIAAEIPKPELLFIAGLFHDLAKGRGGDHSELGELEVIDFAAQHDLPPYDARLVAWLVRHHLSMSRTAQRSDISDPDIVQRFAQFVGNRDRLNYLYLLTVADIRGTNPVAWNGWKDALLSELYRGTLKALRAGLDSHADKHERAQAVCTEARALLSGADIEESALERIWQDFGLDYLLRHRPDEVAWHTQNVAYAKADALPLVLVRRRTVRGGSEVFVYAPHSDLVFMLTTAVLARLNINILDARIIRSASGYTLHTYIVLDANKNAPLESEEQAHHVAQSLREVLLDPGRNPRPPNLRVSRRLKNFHLPTKVSFRASPDGAQSIMEVTGSDRPGFLYRVAMALHLCGVRLHTAKVATFGERVEDLFFLTTLDDQPVLEPLKRECLNSTVHELLDSQAVR